MRRRLSTLAPLALLALAAACPGTATAAVGVSDAHGFARGQVVVKFAGADRARAVPLPEGVGVRRAVAALRRSDRVVYAVPDHIATASAFSPNDSGSVPPVPGEPGGWVRKQWNFLPWEAGTTEGLGAVSPGGIDAIGAWRNLIEAGRPGAVGITVAVLDTGIAYRNVGRAKGRKGARFRRSPDFGPRQFVPGYNFVGDNRRPVDVNGHGTHVASTVAQSTNNRIGLTGLAYRARLMPVQVLDAYGRGRASDIADGIRFATAQGADVINMSFNFACGKKVPEVGEAIREARRKGIVLVASVGNLGSESCVSAPATKRGVIGVGGTTEGGCMGDYSLGGKAVDLVAPGGGRPIAGCRSVLTSSIYQVTLAHHGSRTFETPGSFIGTSMAAAHVSGAAALVLASADLDRRRSRRSVPAQVLNRLQSTARDLAVPRPLQGAGLIDLDRATERPEQAVTG